MSRRRDRVGIAVAVVVVLALAVRAIGLGDRPFHWDEARVGYWTLQYADTGVYEYRPVAGGPLLYLVGRWTLAAFSPSDALARAPVALASGVLPAAALLFRSRLRDDETVGVAVALGFAPPLVYYGRFLRADVILAGVSLVVVGCLVRWVDTDSDRYLYAAVVAAALAFATSGFVVATVVLVVVAGALAFDHRRVVGEGPGAGAALARGARWLRDRVTPLARSLFVFLGTWAVLFTPRGAGVLADPTAVPSRAFSDPVDRFVGVRVHAREGTEFLPFVADATGILLSTAGPLVAVAALGFLADRYGIVGERQRPLVAVTAFWAGLGLVGYPVVAEVVAPWTLVHVLVPLAVPAGVGIAVVYRYGRRAAARDDAARATAALLVLLAVGLHGGIVLADESYGPTTPETDLAQFGQPVDDLEPLVAEMDEALSAAGDEDARVVWVGERYALADESVAHRQPITPESERDAWGERLPLSWYVERTAAETSSADRPADVDGEPAVVIADPAHEAELSERLPDHESRELRLALWNRDVVVFLEQ